MHRGVFLALSSFGVVGSVKAAASRRTPKEANLERTASEGRPYNGLVECEREDVAFFKS
jgi:hypothetical protein